MTSRVLVVDDHEIVRFAVISLLKEQPGLEVVGQAKDGLEAVELTKSLFPDIVLMDLSMPKMNGVEAARQIRKACPDARIIVLSKYDRKPFVLELLQIGISGYLLKDKAVPLLISAIQAALEGEVYLCPRIAKLVVEACLSGGISSHLDTCANELTDRERQVLQLLAEGKSSKQIAMALQVGESTVVTHRQNLMKKLNLHSVAELTKYAILQGITSLYR